MINSYYTKWSYYVDDRKLRLQSNTGSINERASVQLPLNAMRVGK